VSAAPAVFGDYGDDDLSPEEVARRYRTLIDHLPLVVYVDALDSVSSNIFTSPQIEPVLGFSVDEWKTDTNLFSRLLHPDDRARVLAAHAHTHETREPLSIEYRLVARDGRVIWLRDEGVIVLDDHGKPLYLQGYLLDITREREAEQQLRQLALYDPMTGLANRAFFHERLRHAIKLRHDEGRATGLLYIDLDNFKGINDRWGHDLGDEVLKEIGRRIEMSVRPGDTAARLGGDEFAVVLTEPVAPEDAVGVAERLLSEIGRPLESGAAPLYTSASIGIAFGSDDQTLLREADIAMYRAKAQGRDTVCFFAAPAEASRSFPLTFTSALRRAAERGELLVHYQPQVNLHTDMVDGLEALVRWHHPSRGVIPPTDFIHLAEESDLILSIERWVLHTAMTEMASNPFARSLRVAVNLSRRHFDNPALVRRLRTLVGEVGYDFRLLELELSESGIMHHPDRVLDHLKACRDLGMTITVDDFGTGYSCLGLMKDFPLTSLKIDQSFVRNCGTDPVNSALVAAVISMGHALGLEVTAEGVENQAELNYLRKQKCDRAQGWYFGKPVPSSELSEILAHANAR